MSLRLSLNTEEPFPTPTTKPSHSRKKDRMSYFTPTIQIDLTQVRNDRTDEIMHELEVELVNVDNLKDGCVEWIHHQTTNSMSHDSKASLFVESIQTLLASARTLAMKGAK